MKLNLKIPKSALIGLGFLGVFTGGMVVSAFSPDLMRSIIGLEDLVPKSEVINLQRQIQNLKKQTADARKKSFDQQPIDKKPISKDGQATFVFPKEADPPLIRQKAKAKEFIDEIGTTTTPGREIIRSSDLPARTMIPQPAQIDNNVFDFTKINLTPEKVTDLVKIDKRGVVFFLQPSCKTCREAYALAVNLHMRYPDMPIKISFLINESNQVLLYGAWQAIRSFSEEEAWNLLNFAFNNKDMPDSTKVLQAYESLNPKFKLNDLIDFWKNHRNEIKQLIDLPYDIRQKNNWDTYKVPLVIVNGEVLKQNLDVSTIREVYLSSLEK